MIHYNKIMPSLQILLLLLLGGPLFLLLLFVVLVLLLPGGPQGVVQVVEGGVAATIVPDIWI